MSASLTEKTFHALKWGYAGTAFQAGLQFLVGMILARLLSPEAFGLVGMALIAINFATLVGGLGFSAAIIQYPMLTQKHVRAAFSASVFVGGVLFLMIWFLAPVIAQTFHQEDLTSMLRVVGLSLLVTGMSLVSASLLRRNLRFRALTIAETLSYLVGFGGVGISLAVLGFGAWSLIAANVVQPFVLLVSAIYIGGQPLRPYFGLQEYRDLWRVAMAETLNNVVNFASENLHFFAIGKWMGPSALGLYSRSFSLMQIPVKYFSFVLSSVMFPVYATIQSDISRLGRAFLHTMSLTGVITMPVFFAMVAAPEVVIGGVFGDQWKPAAGAFQILCVSGPFMAMMRVFGAVSHARGYVFAECGRQMIHLVVMALALIVLFPYGLEGVALAVAIANVTRYVLLAHLALKLAGVSWRQFVVVQIPGWVVGAFVAVTVHLTAALGANFMISDIVQLPIIILASLMALISTFLVCPSSWFGDLLPWIDKSVSGNLPDWLRRKISAKVLSTVID